MLKELTIEQVAVIEKATMQFRDGLNVLTGETGAGKSIIIDSINAILGNRTTKDLVRAGAPKASIFAVFDHLPEQTQKKLSETGYPQEDELYLQREISAEGKSTCRINGKPAPAGLLKELCGDFITIHGQHDNQALLDASKHLGLLDTYAKNTSFLETYQCEFRKLVSIEKRIQALSQDDEEKDRRIELLRYQIEEISLAELKPDEEEQLMERRNVLRHAQAILDATKGASLALSGEGESAGALDMLAEGGRTLEQVRSYSDDLAKTIDEWNELYYRLQELSSDLQHKSEEFEDDPAELAQIEERLDCIYKLKQKYGDSIPSVLSFLENAKEKLSKIEFADVELDDLLKKRDELYEKVKELADILTEKRLSAFEKLRQELTASLEFLNMPNITFTLSHKKGTLTIHGQDTLEFYITTNKGEEPKPLAKIASGGELSRIMLAFKNALADADSIDTVIYDEIDTGVSGMAAGRIGEMLHKTAAGRQVLCVTHTAQIAAKGDLHLLIRKEIKGERTYTEIQPLEKEERAKEIARIISGDHITELALAGAREMLDLAR